ncbi:hypothetical protein BTVI_106967 [Pitangus sulphuratus]|nr:hypothetical protein BTVI_106967 [Pitangus sulphuratus]
MCTEGRRMGRNTPKLKYWDQKILYCIPGGKMLGPNIQKILESIPFKTKGKSPVISITSTPSSVCTSGWVFTTQMKIMCASGGVGLFNALACGDIRLFF